MQKLSILMPLLTGISALALVINSSLFADDKKKTATGTVVKSGRGELVLKDGEHTLSLEITEQTVLHLNDRSIQLSDVRNGRKAKVTFVKSKKKLVAQQVDVFPIPDDLEPRQA